MKTLRTLLLAACALALAQSLAAQTVTIRATDASTGADVPRVGDDTNDALRVTMVSPTTMPVSGTVAATQSGSWLVQGMVAHDAAYSGNPLPNGCYASAAAPTDVSADGDMVRMWCLRNGALAVSLVNTSIAATQSGTWNITNISGTVSLPTGAATAANQTTGNTSLSSIDTKTPALVTGRVPVDGSGVTQPVSGTVAATQSGTWTVLPGNTANTTAWLVTGTGGTFPATQSGTWSTRTQDGSGNAITSATRGSERALTVQVVDGSGTQVTSFGGAGSNAAASATGSAVSSSASYTGLGVSGTLRGWTGLSLGSQYAGTVAIVDGSGNQVTSFGGSGGTASNVGSAVPAQATAAGQSDGTNLQIPRLFDGDSGGGTQYVQGVILRASGSGGTTEVGTAAAPLQVSLANTASNSTAVKVDGSAVTQPVSGSVTVTQGTATSLKTQAENYQGGTAVGSGNPLQVTLANTGANATAVKVDGSAVTQPVSLAGNQAVNVTQLAGNGISVGNGASGTGVQRVTIANDSTGVVGLSAGTNLVGQVGRQNTFDSAVTLTTTSNFTSLGNGSGWSGGSITTTGCYDVRFRVLTKGSSASNTANIDFYISTAIAGETTMDDAVSTSADQSFTPSGRKNSRFIGSIAMNGTTAVQGSFSVLDTFTTLSGVIVPLAINNSGAALSGTSGDHVIKYECVR